MISFPNFKASLSNLTQMPRHLQTATAVWKKLYRSEKSFSGNFGRAQRLTCYKEKLQAHQRQTQQEIQELQQDRDRLLKKNELAKSKVEAIIQRLAILGTAQDQHAQEIQQLADPTEEIHP